MITQQFLILDIINKNKDKMKILSSKKFYIMSITALIVLINKKKHAQLNYVRIMDKMNETIYT